MSTQIDLQCLRAMLGRAMQRLRAAESELAALDSATGDGDHGAAMRKVAGAVDGCLNDPSHETPAALLEAIGWAVMSIDAGSTGSLYGTWLLGIGEACADVDVLDAAGFADALSGGLTKLSAVSKAQAGDKTLIDALAPAVAAAQEAAGSGQSLQATLEQAAGAAEHGAAGTAEMQAKFGRARNLGERALGHVDPGATSMSIILRGLQEGFING